MAAAPVVRSKVEPLCTGPGVSRIEGPTCPDVQVRHQKKKFYKSRLNSGKKHIMQLNADLVLIVRIDDFCWCTKD